VFICKLCKKLSEAMGGDNHIETVWGSGYVLRDPEPMALHETEKMAMGA
jgi:two-component system cell cycle response regulator CtrA